MLKIEDWLKNSNKHDLEARIVLAVSLGIALYLVVQHIARHF